MISDNTPLTGTREEKVIQCLKKAGWYQGRKNDIAEVESYYSSKGITLTELQKDIFREFYGIAESWYFNYDGDLGRRASDYEFYLMPGNAPELFYIDDRLDPTDVKNYDMDLIRDMKELGQTAGEIPVFIGRIGYYYPSLLFAAHNGRLWIITESRFIESFDNMIDLVTYHFSHPEIWSSVRMRQHLITKK
ncbi:MAG: hypothetical protein HDT25_11130 [Ruminococcus sp.]|nr:hypothetical protein [Ruminococcus sp.]